MAFQRWQIGLDIQNGNSAPLALNDAVTDGSCDTGGSSRCRTIRYATACCKPRQCYRRCWCAGSVIYPALLTARWPAAAAGAAAYAAVAANLTARAGAQPTLTRPHHACSRSKPPRCRWITGWAAAPAARHRRAPRRHRPVAGAAAAGRTAPRRV